MNNYQDVLERLEQATDHEFWFWGTYDELDRAVKSAESVPNGYVVQTKGVR